MVLCSNANSIPAIAMHSADHERCTTGVAQEVPGRTDIGGRTYYEMMPPSVRNGGAHDERLYVKWAEPGGHVMYNSTTFPSFCGGSVTFMLWLRSDRPLHPGYLIRKYESLGSPYSVFIAAGGIEAWGYPFSANGLIVSFPSKIGEIFGPTPKTTGMRHLAVAFDVVCNCMIVHLDGEYVGQQGVPKEFFDFANMDCVPRHPVPPASVSTRKH